MKLRIQESSITLRLLAVEIQKLKLAQLSQTTKMPGGAIHIVVEKTDTKDMEFFYKEETFHFLIPAAEIESWSSSNKIGFRHDYGDLHVVVEKDLPRKKKH